MLSPRRLSLTLLILASPVAALGMVSETPLKLRFETPPAAVETWRPYAGVLEIEARSSAVLADLEFRADGAGEVRAELPPTASLAAGEVLRIPFRAVPTRGDARFGITFTIDGRPGALSFEPGAVRRELAGASMARLVPAAEKAAQSPGRRWPRKVRREPDKAETPRASTDDEASATAPDGPEAAPAGRNIRVRARVVYRRSDGVEEPASGFPFEIYDEDTTYDDLLKRGTTDGNGMIDVTFNWDPCWVCENNPDIYIEVYTQNGDLDVQTAWVEWTYGWDSYVVDDYKGTDLEFGELGLDENRPAAHMFKTLDRAYDIYAGQGYDLDPVDVQWPGDYTFYSSVFEEIHIAPERQWNEASYLHELGHHWQDQYADLVDLSSHYCNGLCDDGVWYSPCGHCAWCQEDDVVAEEEGIANYLSWLIVKVLRDDFEPDPANWRYYEEIPGCEDSHGDPCNCTPSMTEGFLTAFLTDLADARNEDDPIDPEWRDVLTLDPWAILSIDDLQRPDALSEWWQYLTARFPGQVPQIWEVGRNAGIEFDTQRPSLVTGLASPSHQPYTSSPDATIEFEWNESTDDASGIEGYACSVSVGAPADPGATTVVGTRPRYVTDILATGHDYYLNVRAVDRTGKTSSSYASTGPYRIREPYPSDLRFEASAGMPTPVLPTPEVITGPLPAAPAYLTGYGSTYWNFQGRNAGESAIPETFYNRLYVDGAQAGQSALGGGSPGMMFTYPNLGPVQVPGGRHSFAVGLDRTEVVPELDETNNFSGRQYIWSPTILTPDTDFFRYPPPDRTGGWDQIAASYYNADGYRFSGSGRWNAVYCAAWEDTANYGIRLHQPSTSPTDGFGVNQGWSARPAGCLDAVLVNRNLAGSQDWDVGVLNDGGDTSNLTLRHVTSQYLGRTGTMTIDWDNSDLLSLIEFEVASQTEGAISVILDASAYGRAVDLAWLDQNLVTGDLLDARRIETTGRDDIARMDLDVERVGYHCLAVWREPQNSVGGAVLTLTVERTPPDLQPFAASNWYAPLVPRSYDASTPYVVNEPDTLLGNTLLSANGTWLVACAKNEGPMDASAVPSRILLDGETILDYEWYALLSGIPEKRFWSQKYDIRGGRHTLAFHLDDPDSTDEISEDNNVFAMQWAWGPAGASFTANGYRSIPPDPVGGHGDLEPDSTVWYNCDAFRVPAPGPSEPGLWQAVAVMPGTSSNVDMRLHEVLVGARDGYGPYLRTSSWGTGQIDYILIENAATPARPFDVGVIRRGGTQGYHYRARNAASWGSDPVGTHGPYTLGQVEYIDLYEFELQPGRYRFDLESVAGEITWGMALHAAGEPYQSRFDCVPDGSRWLEGPGLPEQMEVEIAGAGRYCLTVWKAKSEDVQESGQYRVTVVQTVTGVAGDDLPEVGRSLAVHPNPFNPRTTVSFALARDGAVRLTVHDVRGRLVRSLVSSVLPAGQHDVTWDGLDGTGRAVASGPYFVRLRTATGQQISKMTLVR